MFKKLLKPFMWCTIVLAIMALVYFMIGMGNSTDIFRQYDSIKPDSSSSYSKSLQFLTSYTLGTGDTSLAFNYGLTEEDIYQMTSNGYVGGSSGGGGGSISSHGHIAYKQSSYSNSISSGATISGEGCGWCSLTSAMAELNPDVCGSINPADWLSIMDSSVKSKWGSSGMSWSGPSAWVSRINALGTYGTYTCTQVDHGENTSAYIDLVKTVAGDSNKVVIISSSNGLFTSGGHIICVVDYTDDGAGGYMHVCDSAGIAASNCGISWDEFSSFNLPASTTSYNGKDYHWKQAWIIERTG